MSCMATNAFQSNSQLAELTGNQVTDSTLLSDSHYQYN